MERPDLGTDLQVHTRVTLNGALHVVAVGGDLTTISGVENLAQAVALRLSTPLGDLGHLGHPEYGSRLHLLIGRLITPAVLSLARAYVREALRRESRVEDLVAVDVIPDPGAPGVLLIRISVKPVGYAAPINLSLSFATDPGQGGGNGS